MMWWSKHVSNRPLVIIVTILSVSLIILIIGLYMNPLPSFSEPLLGFESRGSEISRRINTWKLLKHSTSWNGQLTLIPSHEMSNKKTLNFAQSNVSYNDDDEKMEEKVIGEMASEHNYSLKNHIIKGKEMFCGKLMREYAHFVVESDDGTDLFTIDSIKLMCQIDHQLLRFSDNRDSQFEVNCEQKNFGSCCESHTLANYIAFAANKSSCNDIEDRDVQMMKSLLESCVSHYHKLHINADCADDPQLCPKVPKECFDHENAIYNVMHYLVDYKFMNQNPPLNTKLRYSSIFLPIAKSTKLLPYYDEISKFTLQINHVHVIGMDLGLKHTLFDKYLLNDTIYLIFAIIAILLSIFLYTGSVIVTFIAVAIIVSSLGTSYFLYMTVLRMPYFPFINLLAIIIAVGIGSDNTLIYCKVWEYNKSDKTCTIFAKLVDDTFRHTFMSIFGASATTSVAFFATYFTEITAIKCFSIFAGTSVIANFIYTILLLPPAIVISEKSSINILSLIPFCWKIRSLISLKMKGYFENTLFNIIFKFRILWIITLGFLAMFSITIVAYSPKLKLPDSDEFQVLDYNHPFEKYDLQLKDQFWFSRSKDRSEFFTMPIRVMFGVKAEDNGNYLSPIDRGSLEFDYNFDITDRDAQNWMLQFCKDLRSQSFYQPTIGPLLSNCFIETFKSWMDDRRCRDGVNADSNRYPCCNVSVFPYNRKVFNYCLSNVMLLLDKTPFYSMGSNWGGPRFDRHTHEIVAAVIEYDSVYSFSHSYIQMNEFWSTVNSWISNKMKTAPEGLKNGWFMSDNLEFYSLQESLSKGTIIAIGFAVMFAFIALIFTTWNVVLSILAIITISCIIFTTIAILILMGWKLNIVESISISLVIGLAIDLTLHYTVAYKFSMNNDRKASVRSAFCRIGISAAMAALTTILAGVLMLQSSVLAYMRIGTLLLILSFVSWIYSTIFYSSLLCAFGPQNPNPRTDPLQFFCSYCDESSPMASNAVRSSTLDSISSDKTLVKKITSPHALSSSTISTSSITNSSGCHNQENHELAPLTS